MKQKTTALPPYTPVPRQKRRGRLPPLAATRIAERIAEGKSTPKEVHDELVREGAPVSLREVQRRFREQTIDDRSGPWRITDARDADELALLLDVVPAVIEQTEGRRATLTKAEALIVLAFRRAVPEVHPVWAYLRGRAYLIAKEHNDQDALTAIEAELAYARIDARAPDPTEVPGMRRFYRAVESGWIPGTQDLAHLLVSRRGAGGRLGEGAESLANRLAASLKATRVELALEKAGKAAAKTTTTARKGAQKGRKK